MRAPYFGFLAAIFIALSMLSGPHHDPGPLERRIWPILLATSVAGILLAVITKLVGNNRKLSIKATALYTGTNKEVCHA